MFCIVNPTFVYGPFAPGTKIDKGDIRALSTAALFYQAVLPQGGSASNTIDRTPQSIAAPLTIDVRDVARAHILAHQPAAPALSAAALALGRPARLAAVDLTRCHQIGKEMVQWLRMYVAEVRCETVKNVWGEPFSP